MKLNLLMRRFATEADARRWFRLLPPPPAAFVRRYMTLAEEPESGHPKFSEAFRVIIDQLP
jgi:hypothetical protein